MRKYLRQLKPAWIWVQATQERKLWATAAAVPLSWALLFWLFYLSIWAGAFGNLPRKKELANIRNYTASEVYSADSVLLGRFFFEDRSEEKLSAMPLHLLQALVATEDARFFRHRGIDMAGLARVAVKSVFLGNSSSGGGSTLSQQLAKNLYKRPRLGPLTLPVAKVRESVIARRLERVYAKEEILTLYLNTVPFGENVFGIGSAAQRYFSKPTEALTIEESALLVGMLKATSSYNPRRNPEDAKNRRNIVLAQMEKYGYLPTSKLDSFQAIPLELKYRNLTASDGSAAYFRQAVRNQLKSWFEAHPRPDGSIYNLYTDGLKVYTTLDAKLQQAAEAAMVRHMTYLQGRFNEHWKTKNPWDGQPSSFKQALRQSERYQRLAAGGMKEAEIVRVMKSEKTPMKVFTWAGERDTTLTPYDSVAHYFRFLQVGLCAIEPATGAVKAWVGGIDHRYFKYDHVQARRQVGSTFKPIVYAAAIENGADPCVLIPNVQHAWRGWAPSNSDGKYGGFYSMKGGLTHSVNTISAAVMQQAGIPAVVKFARNLGIESPLAEDPTLVLGTSDLTVLEMTAAYAAIAAGGEYRDPWFITRVADRDGQTISEMPFRPNKRRAMSARTAALITDMMRSVINQGTGGSLRSSFGITADIAGKTGTTQDQADGWFIGITPGLACGVWVGGPDRTVRFRSMSLGQGARTALPIWGHFMAAYFKSSPSRNRYPALPHLAASDSAAVNCPLFVPDPDTAEADSALKPIPLLLRNIFPRDTVRKQERQPPQKGDILRRLRIFQKKPDQ